MRDKWLFSVRGVGVHHKERNGGVSKWHGVVQLLHGVQGEIDKVDNDGWTPIIWAAANGHANVVEMLMGLGADGEKESNDGQTTLFILQHTMDMDMLWKCCSRVELM